MKLVSWNVNGIRACLKKDFMTFFEKLLDYILQYDDVEIMTGKDIYNWYTEQVPENT